MGILIISVVLGMAGAALILAIGKRSGLLDEPGQRSSHQIPTPKGGGIGILAAFVVGCLWTGIATHIMILCGLVSFLGLLSDRMDIAPHRRLVIQILCAFGIMYFSADHTFGSIGLFWLTVMLGGIFIVGTANFYNFMVGINGIAPAHLPERLLSSRINDRSNTSRTGDFVIIYPQVSHFCLFPCS